ncbi:hypothetical protein LINGRAHAP2_LOCUS29319 [Linum grandiflorum]
MDKQAWVEGCYYSLICFLKQYPPPLFSIAVAITLFLCFGFSPSLVSTSLLLFSTIFIVCFSNRKPVKLKEEVVVEKLNQEELETVDEYEVESTEFPLDGESSDDSPRNEGFQLNWKMPFNDVINQSLPICESENEDEDDGDHLIEISLPPIKSNSVDTNEEEEGMVDEANEEDNLIEIDLAIGSIKHSKLKGLVG